MKKDHKPESGERAHRDLRRNVIRMTLAIPRDIHAAAEDVAAAEMNHTSSILIRWLMAGADAYARQGASESQTVYRIRPFESRLLVPVDDVESALAHGEGDDHK